MTYRIAFIIEQTLGHITFYNNLVEQVARDPSIEPIWMPIPYSADDRWSRIWPVNRNMSLLLSLRARDRLHLQMRTQIPNVVLYHTQVTALFGLPLMNRIPTVLSLDATPLNMDTLGAAYNHRGDAPGAVSSLKRRWHRKVFRTAAAITTWNLWAKNSLIRDYDIAQEKITVIPPGVDTEKWKPTPFNMRPQHKLARVLFVGGDFARKGGDLLMHTYRAYLVGLCTLDIVTRDATIKSEGAVRVHVGLGPNSSKLRELFGQADIFILPSLGDVSPVVIMEAMASGLPVISTEVGAIRELVDNGNTGLLVPPNDSPALARAVASLAADPERRRAFGAAGRTRAEQLFSLALNSGKLMCLLKTVAGTV